MSPDRVTWRTASCARSYLDGHGNTSLLLCVSSSSVVRVDVMVF